MASRSESDDFGSRDGIREGSGRRSSGPGRHDAPIPLHTLGSPVDQDDDLVTYQDPPWAVPLPMSPVTPPTAQTPQALQPLQSPQSPQSPQTGQPRWGPLPLGTDLLLRPTQPSYAPIAAPSSPTSSVADLASQAPVSWPIGVKAALLLALLVLVMNAAILFCASVTFKISEGLGTLLSGRCAEVEGASHGVRIALNMVATLVLGAGNYCMQCLGAPTRKEVDEKHARRKWLDIGVLSVRNLKVVGKTRVFLWLLLAVTSLAAHFFFNSAIIATVEINRYSAVAVFPEFLEGAEWSVPGGDATLSAIVQQVQQEATSYRRLGPEQCIREYIDVFVSGVGNVIAVMRGPAIENSLAGIYSWEYPAHENSWVCHPNITEEYLIEPTSIHELDCTLAGALADLPMTIGGRIVDYCLSQETGPQTCRLQFSIPIMVAVIILNVLTLISIMSMMFWSADTPLMTAGDAISSFLKVPDRATRGMCTMAVDDIKRNWPPMPQAQTWRTRRYFRWQAVGMWKALAINVLALSCLAIFAAVLYKGTQEARRKGDMASWKSFGVGAQRSTSLARWAKPSIDPGTLAGISLLANLPQLLVSALYVAYNHAFSCMALSKEWAQHFHGPKRLRVTAPLGQQQSTRYLSLPFKYTVSIMVSTATLHFFASEGLFAIRFLVHDVRHRGLGDDALATVGFSASALVILLAVATGLLVLSVGLGFRRLPAGMPLAGPCSAAMSAACHVDETEDGGSTAEFEVQYGVVSTKNNVGHLAFSALPVSRPVDGRLYL